MYGCTGEDKCRAPWKASLTADATGSKHMESLLALLSLMNLIEWGALVAGFLFDVERDGTADSDASKSRSDELGASDGDVFIVG